MFKYYIKKLRQLKGKVQQSFWDRKKVSLIISVTNKKKEIAQHVQCIVDYKWNYPNHLKNQLSLM